MSTTVRTTGLGITPAATIRPQYTNLLRSYFVAGNAISATHINLLSSFVNAVVGHTHSISEYGRIADYGNTGYTNGPYNSTSGSNGTFSYSVASGNAISASGHNLMVSSTTSMMSHSHTFTDNVN